VNEFAERSEELFLADGLDEVGGDAEFAAARSVTEVSGRGEHEDADIVKSGVLAQLRGKSEAVGIGHVGVQDEERKRSRGRFGGVKEVEG